MTYGLWLSAAGMQANQYRQDVLANNIANVNTTGFKKDVTVLRERAVESTSGAAGLKFNNALLDAMSGGTFVAPTYHSFAEGPLTQTGNPLDVAIHGDGFFAVQDEGEVKYTRDGRFTTNVNNELVMVAGEGEARVLDDANSPIVLLPATAGTPKIAADGTIRQGDAVVGKIGMFEFADRNTLRKEGANLFKATDGTGQPAENSTLLARTIEESTVNPVDGLTTLIEVARAFQLNATMVQLQDSTVGQAISQVGRIG